MDCGCGDRKRLDKKNSDENACDMMKQSKRKNDFIDLTFEYQ